MAYCSLEPVSKNEIVVQLPSGDIQKMHIEEYVKGVVPREMPASWPMAALEAQAICARTYALAQRGRHKDQGFDVCSTTHCQVYSEARHERTDLAVERTWSIVGLYDGNIRPMWFSSACGGQTKETFWPNSYLRVRDDCPCNKFVNGHQNGMCQWGAKALADDMKTRNEILDFYYDLDYVDNYGIAEYEMNFDLEARLLALENLVSEVEARGLNNTREINTVRTNTIQTVLLLQEQNSSIRKRLDAAEADLKVLAPLIRLLGGRRVG